MTLTDLTLGRRPEGRTDVGRVCDVLEHQHETCTGEEFRQRRLFWALHRRECAAMNGVAGELFGDLVRDDIHRHVCIAEEGYRVSKPLFLDENRARVMTGGEGALDDLR